MKLIDFLEKFTPGKFTWASATAWDLIRETHNIPSSETGDGGQPVLTELLQMIKAGAFEDYPGER